MASASPLFSPGAVPNTSGVRCAADRLCVADSEARLIEALREAGGRALVLGQGSNLVLPDRLARPVVLAGWCGLSLDERGGEALLTAAAGEGWHGVVCHSLGQGWAGLENLALIPGSAGAAPIQNIGAYGVELSERLVEVRVFDRAEDRVRTLPAAACRFGYRSSLFKAEPARYAVLSLTLRLARRPSLRLDYPDVGRELARLGVAQPTPRQVAAAVIRIRRRKLPDPRQWGNVGSFFKNPIIDPGAAERLGQREPGLVAHPVAGGVKLAAAQLIDRCGWKGRRLGEVGVWPRQPLVLVNHGQGRAPDFLALGEAIRRSVLERFGVSLELEPSVLSRMP